MTVEAHGAVVFREAFADDEGALGRLFLRNDISGVTTYFDPFPLTADTARRLTRERRRDRFYVAVDGQDIVGLSMLRGWDEGYSVPSFGILVDHRWHGRGIGASLTDYTLRKARELGCARVRLSVYASNRVAEEMYRRRGFAEASREVVTRPAGTDERIVMTKEL